MQQYCCRYFVFCKNENCCKPIQIPYSNLLERLPFHEVRNPDAGSENVACPECGHVFYYSPADRQSYYDDRNPVQDEEIALRVGIVKFDCAEEKDEGLVEILLPIS